MKRYLIVLLFLMFAGVLYSQDFSLVTIGAAGIEIDSSHNFVEVQAMVGTQPRVTVGVFDASAVFLTLLNKEVPTFYAGSEVGLRVWQAPNQASGISVTGRYLFGTAGRQLIGGGARYRIDRTTVYATGDYEFKKNNVLLLLGVGFDIIPVKKNNMGRGGSLPKRTNDKVYE